LIFFLDYLLKDPTDAFYELVSNPCLPLTSLPAGDTTCPSGTLTCQLTQSDNEPAHLVADQINSYQYSTQAQSLVINQIGGDFCSGYLTNRQITYVFTCGETTLPIFSHEDECHYYLNWTSSAACPLPYVPPPTPSPPFIPDPTPTPSLDPEKEEEGLHPGVIAGLAVVAAAAFVTLGYIIYTKTRRRPYVDYEPIN